MSHEDITSFIREIPRNPALQDRLRQIEVHDPDATLLGVISAAQEAGYSFSVQELQLALKGDQELGDEDLKVVLGGVGGLAPIMSFLGLCP